MTSEAQGQAFEDTFEDLLRLVLEGDLGYTLLQLSAQPRGSQFGKDIQIRWRDGAGDEWFWHFECKSHGGATLPAKEVADKLLAIARSSHMPDVWCLALSDAEPASELDELLAAAPEQLALGFGLTVFSPKRQFLKQLYACHPSVYQRQYGAPAPSLTRKERATRIAAFGEWLLQQSVASRARRLPPGWRRVTSKSFASLADNSSRAQQYLRGLTLGCPWEAAVHGWAVPRPSAEVPLTSFIADARPGVEFRWLVGAGGEGKSTILRRVALQVAKAQDDAIVLWADDSAPAAFPTEWLLREVPEGSRIALFVDETRQFDSLRAVSGDEVWQARGTSIAVVMADRGSGWRRHRHRILPQRMRAAPELLGPLTEPERDALVLALHVRGLLHDVSPEAAREKLDGAAAGLSRDVRRRRTEKSWLVPTLIQLTDPLNRPFEDILLSVLRDLRDGGDDAAVQALLVVALVHAAGSALPKDLAERVVGGPEQWVTVHESLIAELERQFGVGLATGRGPLTEEYETHGAAASAGLLLAADSDPTFLELLKIACRKLVESVGPEYSTTDLLRSDRFDLLDRSADYLTKATVQSAVAVELLSAWVALDETRGFPAMQRLGTAYSRWLAAARGSQSADVYELVAVLGAGRAAFARALVSMRSVLSGPGRPGPYEQYELDLQEGYVYQAWAVLELTAADAPEPELKREGDLIRGLYLAVICLALGGKSRILALGVLADSLFALEKFEAAAFAFSATQELTSARDRVVQRGVSKLDGLGMKLPAATPDAMPHAVCAALDLLEGRLDGLGVEATSAGHSSKLDRSLHVLMSEFPSAVWPT